MALIGPDGERGSLEYIINPGGNHRGESHRGFIAPAHRGSWSEKDASEQNYQGDHGTDVKGHPETRSLGETFEDSPGLLGLIGSKLGYGSEETTEPREGLDDYVDAENHVTEREVEPIDPTEHNVDYVNTWIDAAIRAGDVEQAREVYQKEKNRGEYGRKGIKQAYNEIDFVTEEEGLIDPTNYGVQALQHWMDERLEEGAIEMIGLLLEQEGESNARRGVMEYENLPGEISAVEEVGDLRVTVESEEDQFYDSIKLE